MRPKLVRPGNHADSRGELKFGEFPAELPFIPQRVFVISEVPIDSVRGEHAHSTTSQILICVSGSVTAAFQSSAGDTSFELSSSSEWLFVPPMNFGKLTKFSSDCALVVLASEPYNASEYISDLAEFQRLEALQK